MRVVIRPSAIIRQNYNTISNLCKRTGEPVFLTKNGVGDLVVMDINTYNQRECQLELRERLVEAEEMRLMGIRDIPVETVCGRLRTLVEQDSFDRKGGGGNFYVSS